jgi:hypothetical protein
MANFCPPPGRPASLGWEPAPRDGGGVAESGAVGRPEERARRLRAGRRDRRWTGRHRDLSALRGVVREGSGGDDRKAARNETAMLREPPHQAEALRARIESGLTMASLTQISIGPSARSISSVACSTARHRAGARARGNVWPRPPEQPRRLVLTARDERHVRTPCCECTSDRPPHAGRWASDRHAFPNQ